MYKRVTMRIIIVGATFEQGMKTTTCEFTPHGMPTLIHVCSYQTYNISRWDATPLTLISNSIQFVY